MDDSPTTSLNDNTGLNPAGRAPMLSAGEIFGTYRIVRLLGQGGMGEVYEAEDVESGRRLALKTLRQSMARSSDRQRFLREGRLAASVNHPNSVYIYGTEEIQRTPVITMELVGGGSLKDRVDEKGPMPSAEAVDAILQVIAGLEAAQAVGVLHRDIKPSNLFVDSDGTIKIGDFGLSVSTVSMETQLTAAGTIMGTPMFAPPEQLRGDDLDVRSDIYSVGASLYHLMTGQPPFNVRDAVKLIAAVIQDPPLPLHTLNAKIPPGLATVVMRCLEKKPPARFSTYEELRGALTPFSSTAPVPASLPLRFLASLIDSIPASLIGAVLGASLVTGSLASGNSGPIPQLPLPLLMLLSSISILYYTCFEGLCGAGAGKAICGIRVIRKDGEKPGVVRAFIRVAGFTFLGWVSVSISTLTAPHSQAFAILFPNTVALLNFAFLFSFAGRSNGFAGLHDRLSGTRVVVKPRSRPSTLLGKSSSLPFVSTATIGPYAVVESIAKTGEEEVFSAYDPKLLRRVWIHRRPPGAASVAEGRRDLKRSTRLRWLNGKRTPQESWDAYGFVDGTPLVSALQTAQPWSEVRQWLLSMSEEIVQAASDGTFLAATPADRIWIASDNRARLLEFPSTPAGSTAAPTLTFHELHSAQETLFRIAAASLEGRASALSGDLPPLPSIPLPLGARRTLDMLRQKSLTSFETLVQHLNRLTESDASLTRWRRAGNVLATAVVFTFVAVSAGMVGMLFTRDLVKYPDADRFFRCVQRLTRSTDEGEKQALETYISGRFRATFTDRKNWPGTTNIVFAQRPELLKTAERIFAQPPPAQADVNAAARKLEKYLTEVDEGIRIRSGVQGIIALVFGLAMMLMTVIGVFALILAVTLRDKGLFSLFGVAVVRADGVEVTRMRAGVRAFIAFTPAFIGAAGIWGGANAVSPFRTALLILGFVLMTAGAAAAIWNPQRGLQDRLAFTALVPK